VAPRTRLPQVLGGTWPAQIWNLFMSQATRHMPVRTFPQPTQQYVTVAIDTSRNCLPNQFTPAYLIRSVTYLEGTQPTERCTQPTSYQMLGVPSVIGMKQDHAIGLLHDAGFQVTTSAQYSHEPVGTVVGQSPAAGSQALQSSTVTIQVSVGPRPPAPCPTDSPTPTPSASPTTSPSPGATPSPSPSPCVPVTPSPGVSPTMVTVPNVTGLLQDQAIKRLQQAGFGVAVRQRAECTGGNGCHPRPGAVWKEDPRAGTSLAQGSTVTLWVNP